MPEAKTLKRAREAKRRGKSPSTQAGEFVREEIHHIRAGAHGARSTKQAIAIGLSKARRAGVELPPPAKGRTTDTTRRRAIRDYRRGHDGAARRPSRRRSRATLKALRREGSRAVSTESLARHARVVARRKSASERSRAAKKAARTRTTTSRPGNKSGH